MKPEKTNLAIHIGVTGHRDVTAEEKQKLDEICGNILKYISDYTHELCGQVKNYYKDTTPKLRLITSLAEGFDRIATYPALSLGYELQCPLPYSRKDYLKDFSTDESKNEFNELLSKASAVYELDFGRDSFEKAYLNAGSVMLDYTDILLAFWDGKPSRGEGGTADIIEMAEESGILTIQVDRNMTVSCSRDLNWKAKIRNYIDNLVLPSGEKDKFNSFPATYFEDEISSKKGAQLYNRLVRLFSPKKKKEKKSEQEVELTSKKVSEGFTKRQNYFSSYCDTADKLAVYYSNQYRSIGILKCLLPLLATIALAFGFYWNWSMKENTVNLIGFLLQAVFLYFMARVIGVSTDKNKWHQKFIDYRILAECLRYKPFLSTFGVTLRQIHIPAYNKNAALSWINWYMRCIVREYGLPNEVITDRVVNDALELYKKDILSSQKKYHKGKAESLKAVSGKLEKVGLVFFVLGATVTLLRVGIHYAFINNNIEWFPSVKYKLIRVPTFFNLLSLLLPAIGSVFAAIEAQAGFKRLSERDMFMADQLEVFIRESDELENKSFLIKRKWITNISEAMIDEVCDWRVFLKSKTIPKK